MIFSIIMPVYNVEEYLSEAIESVLNQKFTDFELLLINDGSTDHSLGIANSYKEKDTRIQLITQANKGLSAARNTGLRLAKGDYIYFIDSDDWILDTLLSTVFEKIQIKNYDIINFIAESFITSFKTKEENKAILNRYDSYYKRSYLVDGEYSVWKYQEMMDKNHNFVPSACLYVFKKELIVDNKLQFFEGILFEDNLFTRELLAYSKNMYFLPQKLYKRRIREGSITTSMIDYRTPYSYLMISDQLFNLSLIFKENNFLRKDSILFFRKSFDLITNQFKDSKELKLNLFRVHSKLKIKKYKNKIIQMKYPLLKYPILFRRWIKTVCFRF